MRGLLRLRTLIVLAVVLVVAYAAVSWVFSEKLIAPQARPLGKVDPADYGLPNPTVVEVPGKGVKLASWYFPNPRNEHCAVIMLHGFGGARAEVVGASPIFWDRGCDLLMYDSRGHGEPGRGDPAREGPGAFDPLAPGRIHALPALGEDLRGE